MTAKSNADATSTPQDVLDPARALTVQSVRVNESRVRRGFWPKLRRLAAHIPFADQVLAVYYCTRDPATPMAAKGMMMAALAYFVLPTDAVPDILAGIGFTDDAAVLAALMAIVGKNVKPQHKIAAQGALDRLAGRS